MPPVQDLGIAHFLAQADPLARAIVAVLLTMSLVSWYLILSRALSHLLEWRRGEAFARAAARVASLQALESQLARAPGEHALKTLAAAALEAGQRCEQLRRRRAADDPLPAELFARDLDGALAEAAMRMERGLIVLASIGSSAPYIGLLGTVWGVYHALVSIGLSGQGTLDQVAGPVGEALIMTALGLAVAIPAVLGYNALVRANRVQMARLNAMANRLTRLVSAGGDPIAEPACAPVHSHATAAGVA